MGLTEVGNRLENIPKVNSRDAPSRGGRHGKKAALANVRVLLRGRRLTARHVAPTFMAIVFMCGTVCRYVDVGLILRYLLSPSILPISVYYPPESRL